MINENLFVQPGTMIKVVNEAPSNGKMFGYGIYFAWGVFVAVGQLLILERLFNLIF